MIKSSFIAVLLIAAAVQGASTATDRQLVWTRTWTEIRDHFTGFDRVPQIRWDDSLKATSISLQGVSNEVEFWRQLRRRITALNDGRTQLTLPGGLEPVYDLVPIRMIVACDKVLVKKLGDSPDVQKSGIKVGDELVSVDDVPVLDYLEKECVPDVSGSTKNGRLAEAVFRVLTGKKNTPCRMSLRRPDGTTYDVTLTRDSGPSGKYYAGLFDPYGLVQKMETPKILHLRPNYLDSWSIETQMLSEINSHPDLEGLIVDLRDAGTGSVLEKLLAKLALFPLPKGALREVAWKSVPSKITPGTYQFEREWRNVPEETIQPADTVFRGKVVLLVNSETSGPAEQFIEPLIWAKRATLIGDTTAGAGGDIMEIGFPTGGTLSLTVRRPNWENGCGDGKGFPPDMYVVPTAAGLASGKDEVLDAAVKWLSTPK